MILHLPRFIYILCWATLTQLARIPLCKIKIEKILFQILVKQGSSKQLIVITTEPRNWRHIRTNIHQTLAIYTMNDLKLGINSDLQYRGNRIPLSFLKLRKLFKKSFIRKINFRELKLRTKKIPASLAFQLESFYS